jgi:hypothetical protein
MPSSTLAAAARKSWLVPVAVIAGAALLRVPGLSTDLWLDEIWSLLNVQAARGWLDLVLGTRIDGNHHLNSFYLYVIGAQSRPEPYRLLAFVSGIAAVATAWMIGARESRVTALVTALIFGTSYAMVFYSTESRGYATVVWMTLAAWYFLLRHAESPGIYSAVGFTICCVLGFMAHQTLAFFFAGAFIWFDAHAQRASGSVKRATRATWQLFVPAGSLIAAFYVIAISGQSTAGGPPYRAATIIAQTLSAMSGGPQAGTGLWLAGALVGIVVLVSIVDAYRSGDDRWLAWVSAGIVIPAIIVVARQPITMAPRYLIVPMTMLLLAAAGWLSRQLAKGGWPAAVAASLIAIHVVSGTVRSQHILRGRYSDAIRDMIAWSGGGPSTVASANIYDGHDVRNQMILKYYGQALHVSERLRYVDEREFQRRPSEWLIVESLGEPPRSQMIDPLRHVFQLMKTYPTGDLSGTTWHVYRQVRPAQQSDAAVCRQPDRRRG